LIGELSSLSYDTFILEDSRILPYADIPDYHTLIAFVSSEKSASHFLYKNSAAKASRVEVHPAAIRFNRQSLDLPGR